LIPRNGQGKKDGLPTNHAPASKPPGPPGTEPEIAEAIALEITEEKTDAATTRRTDGTDGSSTEPIAEVAKPED